MDFDALASEVARTNEGGRWADASAAVGRALGSGELAVEDESRALDLAIEQILLLEEHAELSEAGHLAYDVSTWLEGPREARLVYGARRSQLQALRELHELAPSFPEQVRMVLARGLRTGDLVTAHRQLQTLLDTAPDDAKAAREQLEQKAVTLFGLFGGHLVEDPRETDAGARSFTTMLAVGAAMLGLFFVIRTPHKAPKVLPDTGVTVSANVALHEAAKTTASTLGAEATQKSAFAVASAADRVRLALGRRDCKDARAAMAEVKDAVEKTSDNTLRTTMDKLDREVSAACP